jgi:hypothetical protein
MKRIIPLIALALAASASAQDQRGGSPGFGSGITPIGNPSALIAAESAFARMAREKGQWTAFAATSTDDAEMFVPQRTLAKAWLKGRANPPQAVQRQASSVWMSCDGSAGVTFGGYQDGTANGWFSTVWQRQPKKGNYKWVLDQGGALAAPLAGADFITGKVADCVPRPHRNPLADDPPPPPEAPQGHAPAAAPAARTDPYARRTCGSRQQGWPLERRYARLALHGCCPAARANGPVWMWQDGKMNEVLKRTEIAKNEG